MDLRYTLSRRLISCGTILAVAALVLVGYTTYLSAEDIRDHRSQASSLLREGHIDRVTLSEWEPPANVIAWVALIGGFGLIGTGIREAAKNPGNPKGPRRDEFE